MPKQQIAAAENVLLPPPPCNTSIQKEMGAGNKVFS